MQKNNPKLFVFTGPSGVGKGTILEGFLSRHKKNVRYSISSTTRSPRQGEIHGVNYFFVSKEEFEKGIEEGKFLEWAKYNENYYGTSIETVKSFLKEGLDVLLEIEVQGALQIMKKVPECVSIFIMPPSVEELEHRLRGRKTEDEETIKNRLKIAKAELAVAKNYKYAIINDELERAVNEMSEIYEKETKCH